jgi:hypothetical protein
VAKIRERALRAWETRRRNLQLKPIVRAISIRQPYAEMILRRKKREEYRSRPTLVKGRVYLYAALRPGDNSDWQKLGMRPGELPTGKVVGTVEIIGCRWNPFRRCYAYVLRDPRRLRRLLVPKNQPLPCFWKPQF